MNLTEESEKMIKKSKNQEYDAYFYKMVEKIGEFNEKDKILYLKKNIKSDNEYLLTLMEGYKFYLSKSLF